jgi:hypothetical protein
VLVTSQESKQSCICMIGASIVFPFYDFSLDIRTFSDNVVFCFLPFID